MIVDITNEVLTKVKTDLATSFPALKVTDGYQESVSFPLVTIRESTNIVMDGTKDSAGEHYSQCSLEINIFTTGTKKVSDAKKIRNAVDGILGDYYGMTRNDSLEVPNYLDTNVYRYLMRYSFVVSENKQIYNS